MRREAPPDAEMGARAAARGAARPGLGAALLGRVFVHPVFDYALIGGGLSLLATLCVALVPAAQSVGQLAPTGGSGLPLELLVVATLFSSTTHFGASTVRLYTKPGSFAALPFLTLSFPLVMLVLVVLCLRFPDALGRNFQSLYLTWSPYHYAAQSYGIAVAYSYRSGLRLEPADKRRLRWVAMLPFLYMFVSAQGVGIDWLLPELAARGAAARAVLGGALELLCLIAPLLLFVWLWRSEGRPMPLIALLPIVANGIWFIVLGPLHAFLFAAIFHAIQYLAIAMVFYLRDRVNAPGNSRGALYHGLRFYALSLGIGYVLYQCVPHGYAWAGFGLTESVIVFTAAINVHHFVVDAFIWRFAKGDSNRSVVEQRPQASGLGGPVPA